MIKTLQKKYISSAMIAVTIVMVIYFAAINILNVYSAGHDAEKTLQLIMSEELQSSPDEKDPREPGDLRPGSAKPDNELSSASAKSDDKPSSSSAKPDNELSSSSAKPDDKPSSTPAEQNDNEAGGS